MFDDFHPGLVAGLVGALISILLPKIFHGISVFCKRHQVVQSMEDLDNRLGPVLERMAKYDPAIPWTKVLEDAKKINVSSWYNVFNLLKLNEIINSPTSEIYTTMKVAQLVAAEAAADVAESAANRGKEGVLVHRDGQWGYQSARVHPPHPSSAAPHPLYPPFQPESKQSEWEWKWVAVSRSGMWEWQWIRVSKQSELEWKEVPGTGNQWIRVPPRSRMGPRPPTSGPVPAPVPVTATATATATLYRPASAPSPPPPPPPQPPTSATATATDSATTILYPPPSPEKEERKEEKKEKPMGSLRPPQEEKKEEKPMGRSERPEIYWPPMDFAAGAPVPPAPHPSPRDSKDQEGKKIKEKAKMKEEEPYKQKSSQENKKERCQEEEMPHHPHHREEEEARKEENEEKTAPYEKECKNLLPSSEDPLHTISSSHQEEIRPPGLPRRRRRGGDIREHGHGNEADASAHPRFP